MENSTVTMERSTMKSITVENNEAIKALSKQITELHESLKNLSDQMLILFKNVHKEPKSISSTRVSTVPRTSSSITKKP